MKKRYRFLAGCLVMALTAAALSTGVFAARDDDDDIVRPTSIRVTNVYGSDKVKTMSVGQDFEIDYEIKPDYADSFLDVTYSSSNYEVADVDDYGTVTAYAPGEAEITVITENRKRTTFTVKVLGGNRSSSQSEELVDESSSSSSSSGSKSSSSSSASSKSPTATTDTASGKPLIKLTKKVDRDTLIAAVRGAGAGRVVTMVNYLSVSSDSLRAASEEGATAIQFDTKSDKAVVGRLTVYPQNAEELEGDLKVGVYCNTSNTSRVDKYFSDYYKNDFRIVRLDQGQFYMPVRVAVKVGDLSGKNLKFYGYDSVKNNYYDIQVTEARVDGKGYLYFVTSVGGYIIVSDGVLTIK